MKDLKNVISYLLIGISLILVIIYVGGRCSDAKTDEVVHNAEIIQSNALLKDSLITYYSNLQREREDSIQAYYYTLLEQSTTVSDKHKETAKKQAKTANYYKHIADSLAAIAPDTCKKVVEAYVKANETLQGENKSLNEAIVFIENNVIYWKKISESKERELFTADSLIIKKTNTINELSIQNENLLHELNKDDNLWNKSKFWIGFGLGFGVKTLLKK